jgi:hypothetical protein
MVLPSPDTFHDLQSCAEYLKSDNARLTAELAELRERTRWIPVSERLPDHKQSVLAVADREVTNTYYDVNFRKWSQSKYYWFPEGEVTHWMPLPEPPEEIK